MLIISHRKHLSCILHLPKLKTDSTRQSVIHREFLTEYDKTKGSIETDDHLTACFLLVQETFFDVKLYSADFLEVQLLEARDKNVLSVLTISKSYAK